MTSSSGTVQTSQALQDAIRSQILTDGRASHLTPTQLNALVQSLSQQAARQGMTAQQITWTPGVARQSIHASAAVQSQTGSSCSASDPVCALSQQMGISQIWVLLGVVLTIILLAGIVGMVFRALRRKQTV